MREILFKAKRIDNGEWIEGYYVCASENKHYIVKSMTDLGMTFSFVDAQEIDPNTLCQFTGLLDKNGNKIFEGDICQYGDSFFKVIYNNNYARFNVEDKYKTQYKIHTTENFEIIGNIHDKECE